MAALDRLIDSVRGMVMCMDAQAIHAGCRRIVSIPYITL
jgi:hypothetical protein